MFFSVILALSREGKSQGTTFTLKCPILDKQKQIALGSSYRAWFPHSAQVSSLVGQGPNPIGPVSSGCPSEETSSQRLRPRKMATASTLQRQGCGRGSPLLKAWAKATGGPY